MTLACIIKKNLEKEQIKQSKQREEIIKIKAEINESGNWKIFEEINENWLASSQKWRKKYEIFKLIDIRNEREIITIGCMKIKRIIMSNRNNSMPTNLIT